jgi:hypothetical protein
MRSLCIGECNKLLPDKQWQQQIQFHEMQMIFVETMEFVKDLKYERYEYVADICACWLKRPENREEKKRQ